MPTIAELERATGVRIVPDAKCLAAYDLARVPRPPMPLPSSLVSRIAAPDHTETLGGAEWVQVASKEAELIFEGSTSYEPSALAVWLSGLWASEGLSALDMLAPVSDGRVDITRSTLRRLVLAYRDCPLVVEQLPFNCYFPDTVLSLHHNLWSGIGIRTPPDNPLQCNDQEGRPAVRFRRWQVRPDSREYDKEYPRICGCDLLLRHDLLARLSSELQRDVVMVGQRIDCAIEG